MTSGGSVFPIHQFPGEQRVLRLGTANVLRIFLVVIVLPPGEQLVAVPFTQFVEKLVGRVLGRAIAQRIHLDADRQPGQRIMIFRSRQHRPLIAQPPDVADKHSHQQSSGADGNPDLCAGEGHCIEFMELAKARKDYQRKTRKDMYDCGIRVHLRVWSGYSCPLACTTIKTQRAGVPAPHEPKEKARPRAAPHANNYNGRTTLSYLRLLL